ncbi:FAD/NAD(P)-binding domain-containing protein, partial [Sphaerulina musiva SO2202]
MDSTAPSPPLNTAIVGAGIAGLCAGIALKRSDTTRIVTIYEKSTFKNEIGAAITLTPNANRILDRWGFDAKAHGETDKEQVRHVDAHTLEIIHQCGFASVEPEFGHRYNAYHRVDLHRGLKTMAENLGVEIQLGREVVDLDCAEGVLTFKDGTTSKHDLVVVADGIRSTLVKSVTGLDISPHKIGKSVFRGLIPMAALQSNPLIWSQFENQPSGFYTCHHAGKMIMMYPCANDSIMNIAVFHTTRPGHEHDEGWTSPATKADVLSVLQDVHPFWRAIVEAAESDDDFKCFPIKLRAPIPRYNNGRAILIGDAAHPFQPTYAQGGCSSIEDAACLSTLFRNTFSSSSSSINKTIPSRCQLYNDFRLPRDNTTQIYSNIMFDHLTGEEGRINEHNSNDDDDDDDDDQNKNQKKSFEAQIRKFYPQGPLMSGEIPSSWTRPMQEFWFAYDVDREAEKAVRWFERNCEEEEEGCGGKEGAEGKRLP